MMFQRVNRATFYNRVERLRIAARRNGYTFNRRDSDTIQEQSVTYEVNGIANAQAVRRILQSDPLNINYYVLQ